MKLAVLLTLLVTGSSAVYTQPDYGEVLRLSLLFFEAQRSGKLPENNRIPWRGDCDLNDRGLNGEDLTGGYYDAGDYVKFSFTMASTITILAWGCHAYKDAYVDAGEWEHALEALRWGTDYLIKCHPTPFEFYGQVGEFRVAHELWGRPEDMNVSRPAYKIDSLRPGSDLAGEVAAALAATSLVFKGEYADKLLNHSKQLYVFANAFRGLFNTALKGAASEIYQATDYGDELTWAAAWLYKATNIEEFLIAAEFRYQGYRLKERPNEFFYNKKVAGIQVLLGQLTGRLDYLEAAKSFCNFSVDYQKRTPKGLLYIDKEGTLGHAANVAFLCLQAADYGLNPTKYREFAQEQIDYMLGSTGRSFLIGYGEKYPKKPHHLASSCPDPPAPCTWEGDFNSLDDNPQILYGALVSGPDENDYYVDSRDLFVYNEVTLNYNAGFQSAVAGLRHLELHNLINNS